jgi:CubicO group peptidase (beta-lactamase class C family)
LVFGAAACVAPHAQPDPLAAPAAQPAETAAPASARPAYDAIFDEVLKYYRLPGLALGIIEDGKVTYVRTAGEVIEGSGEPITADTLFKIASNTKAMTVGVLARLVDGGKLHWDDPVVKWLPQLRMSEPWITREIRVQDLLIHDSGLPAGAGDLMLWPEPNLFTRADIIAALAHLEPAHSFRSHYDYDNLMYIVAGEVAAAAGGASYEELVRREVFQPVGLTRCRVGEWRLEQAGCVAQPHMREGDRNKLLGRDASVVPAITSAAAGGVRCSLNDMLIWARMWLDPDVRPPGQTKPWISHAQRDAIWTPHIPMPLPDRQRRWDNGHFNAYGYGFRLSDVDGLLQVAHTGTLSGMYSAMTLLPEKNSGFVLLMNGEGSDARTVLKEALLKLFTSPAAAPPAHWYIEQLEQERASDRPPPSEAVTAWRELASPESLAPWLGTYRDPWFGEISICERNGNVRFSSARSPMMSGDVMRAGGRLLVDWEEDAADVEPLLTFAPATKGKPITLTMAKIDPEADFSSDYEDLSFVRIGDCSRVPKPAVLSDREAEVQVDALMHDYVGAVPGASVLVLRGGKPVVSKSYGLANLEEGVPATPQTSYRLASVTKQFTAAAILLLAESGRLTLDDPIRKWLPSLPEAAAPMTIRMLLTHTSGLIDYEEVMPDGLTVQLHDADVLSILEKQNRTYFEPGTSYLYSNSGYSLLALIVERASGQRFAAFLREHIFRPLGMNDTVAFEEGVSSVAHRAFGYTADKAGWTRTDQSLTSAVLGDGGIYSSIDDLAKWDAALYDDRLLRKESRILAFTPKTHTDNSSIDYGFGWRITGETLWHSGETVGFRNVIVRYPRRHLTVVVLTNRNDPEPYRLALGIAAAFLPGAPIR